MFPIFVLGFLKIPSLGRHYLWYNVLRYSMEKRASHQFSGHIPIIGMYRCMQTEINVSVCMFNIFYSVFDYGLIVLSILRNDARSYTERRRHTTSDGSKEPWRERELNFIGSKTNSRT